VADLHTYFVEVGEDQVLVHNTCTPPEGIVITDMAMRKLKEMHVEGGPESSNKTTFYRGVDVEALINSASWETPIYQSPEDTWLYQIDAGFVIGTGYSGKETSKYEVAVAPDGTLVTAYPVD